MINGIVRSDRSCRSDRSGSLHNENRHSGSRNKNQNNQNRNKSQIRNMNQNLYQNMSQNRKDQIADPYSPDLDPKELPRLRGNHQHSTFGDLFENHTFSIASLFFYTGV